MLDNRYFAIAITKIAKNIHVNDITGKHSAQDKKYI